MFKTIYGILHSILGIAALYLCYISATTNDFKLLQIVIALLFFAISAGLFKKIKLLIIPAAAVLALFFFIVAILEAFFVGYAVHFTDHGRVNILVELTCVALCILEVHMIFFARKMSK